MRHIFLFVLFLAVFIGPFVGETQAAEPSGVARVVELMRSKTTKGVIGRWTFPDGDVRIVFVQAGRRYTLFYSSDLVFLSVWVRPDGTGGPEQLETFTDHGLEGQVDFGIAGQKGADSVRKHYNSGADGCSDKRGERFRQYWQQRYDRAIRDALNRLRE